MCLPFLIRYMETYSKPLSTEPLSRRWKHYIVASHALYTSFRTTKCDVICYFELLIDKTLNNLNDEWDDLLKYSEDTFIGISFIKLIKWYLGSEYKGGQGTIISKSLWNKKKIWKICLLVSDVIKTIWADSAYSELYYKHHFYKKHFYNHQYFVFRKPFSENSHHVETIQVICKLINLLLYDTSFYWKILLNRLKHVACRKRKFSSK